MTQADNRAASGTKRARSEGPRGEGDWTCPLCGNVNFAFRATCNMRKCGASKPTDPQPMVIASFYGDEQQQHQHQQQQQHHQQQQQQQQRGPIGPYDQTPPAMFMSGPGVPPPLPMGMNGGYAPVQMVPPSAIPYDYGGGMNLPAGYSPLPLPAYPGTMIGSAVYAGPGGYATPVVDGYGMNMTMFSVMQIQGPRPGIQIEENGSRKRRGGPEGPSEGDWICPKCGNSNFAFRTFCNMRKCATPKPAEPIPRIAPQKSSSQGPTPEGSWTCDACGNVNYPFRTKCNRRNCGVDKPADAKLTTKSSPPSD